MHQQAKERIERAIAQVSAEFPFPGYMVPEISFGHGKYSNIAATVERYLSLAPALSISAVAPVMSPQFYSVLVIAVLEQTT